MEPVGELAAKPPSCHSVPTVPNGAESGDLIVGDVVDLELAGVVVAQNQVGGAGGADGSDARELPLQADRADGGGAGDLIVVDV